MRLARSSHSLLVRAVLLGSAFACGSPPPAEAPEPLPSLEEPGGEGEGGPLSGAVNAIERGDFEAARAALEGVVRDEPGNPRAFFYLGVAQQNLGQGDAAIESYERALELDPRLSEAAVNLTAALLDSGDAARAEPVIERALAAEPGNPALLYNRALAASMTGKRAEAVRAFREALAAEPGNAEIKYGYAEALVEAGSNDAAGKVLGELVQEQDDVAVLASSGRLFGRIEQFDGCIEALDKALSRQSSAELYVARGLCHHGKKADAAAFEDFQRGIQQDSRYAPAHYYAGMHLKSEGKKAEARAALGRAVELGGDSGVGKAARRALEGL